MMMLMKMKMMKNINVVKKNNKEDNKDIGMSSRFFYLRIIIRIRVIIYMMIMNEI